MNANADRLAGIHPEDRLQLSGHVVIVDDQQTSRVILEQIVKNLGTEVSVTSFGDPESVSLDRRPDLFLLDYRMPKTNGIELTRRIRSNPEFETVPIIMVTVVTDMEVRRAALEAGVNDFIARPFDIRETSLRCRNMLVIANRRSSEAGVVAELENLGPFGPPARMRELTERLADGPGFDRGYFSGLLEMREALE